MKKKYVKDYVPTEKDTYEYRGKYYKCKILKEERKKEGIVQTICCIVSLVLLLTALCIPCNGNQTIYVVIPMEITLICLWVQLSGSLKLFKVEDRMEQKDYDRVYQSPIQALTIAIILYVFSLGGQLIGVLMEESRRSSGDIYFSMLLFFILVISCVTWNRRRKMMHSIIEEKQ